MGCSVMRDVASGELLGLVVLVGGAVSGKNKGTNDTTFLLATYIFLFIIIFLKYNKNKKSLENTRLNNIW